MLIIELKSLASFGVSSSKRFKTYADSGWMFFFLLLYINKRKTIDGIYESENKVLNLLVRNQLAMRSR